MSLLLDDDELQESLRQQQLRRQRLEEKQIEDGKKGAVKREENRRARQLAVQEAANAPSPFGASFEDEEDAFGFFVCSLRCILRFEADKAHQTLPPKEAPHGDDDEGSVDGDTPKPATAASGPAKSKAAKPRAKPKPKVPAGDSANGTASGSATPATADGEPPKKRVRRSYVIMTLLQIWLDLKSVSLQESGARSLGRSWHTEAQSGSEEAKSSASSSYASTAYSLVECFSHSGCNVQRSQEFSDAATCIIMLSLHLGFLHLTNKPWRMSLLHFQVHH